MQLTKMSISLQVLCSNWNEILTQKTVGHLPIFTTLCVDNSTCFFFSRYEHLIIQVTYIGYFLDYGYHPENLKDKKKGGGGYYFCYILIKFKD